MDSLEANFPHWFAKTPTLQEVAAAFKLYGERGFASDEVLTSGNEVQCNQTFLDGLLLEQNIIKTAILNNLRAFGLKDEEAFERDPEPVVDEVLEKLQKLNPEIQRLKSHPELFSDDRARREFLKHAAGTARDIGEILSGNIDVLQELKRQMEHPVVEAAPSVPGPPWATWCRSLPMRVPDQPQRLKDFQAANPDMVLVGTQIIPHMGVLIAEHWRKGVGEIITSLGTEHGEPEMLKEYVGLQKMLSDTRIAGGGKQAVLKFRIAQPDAAQSGHIFAFGPQENIAEMARMMALFKSNRDVTTIGFPTAVMIGVFLNKEDAKKMLPHFRPL